MSGAAPRTRADDPGRPLPLDRYLLDNLDWLDEQLGSYEDDYLIIDCPGQIELYTHIPLLPRLVSHLQKKSDFRLCSAYLLESQFMEDKSKFFAGTMSALSCMVSLEVSCVNLLSKMDLVRGRKAKSEVGRCVSSDSPTAEAHKLTSCPLFPQIP